MDREFVKQQLIKCGYTDVTDEIVDEFLERLQEDDELPITPTSPKRASPKPVKKSSPVSKRESPPKQKPRFANVEDDDDEDVDDDEYDEVEESPAKYNQTKRISSQKAASPKRSTRASGSLNKKDEMDDEIRGWMKRVKVIENKGRELDNQMQQCRTAIIDPPADEVDVPMYFGTSERKLDPYPTVKKKAAGGFIRPPPIRSSRKVVNKKGRRLLYEERNPEYIPPPERRRDELRWQIRQKLIYSDPKYH
ncbi:hypothetical protein TRFO_39345 [Tritrichomonas foetus]|uniref:Centriolar and ciliogenesis-associated protein HYLS1 C-terminal domain-containing protein n=1 Tax=Tritrichomonas foetus TaxID=1144522 RepID=A0A1J4J710_9EUKA|nr:hypothetical protein TRFO_39345 [Tritrichomonas foetus]|eukprot:OHS94441.1 hypothetical protein TRFO_39345 [Tritrichomonas foetus]